MPELPEVETIKRQLNREITGKKITGVEVLAVRTLRTSKAQFLEGVVGAKIKSVERRAKLLILNLNNGSSILTHLKMTGQYVYDGEAHKHTRVIFSFGPKLKIMFNDMRRFGYLKLVKTVDLPKFLANEYGPEPLEKSFTVQKLSEILKRRPNMKIKQSLMEQKLIAGIGNIYAQEACFMARVLPTRSAKSLKPDEIQKIYDSIRKVMTEAIKYGGSSAENYLNLYGKEGGFVPHLKVYGRGKEKCRRCGSILKTIKLGGRGTVYCEKCQK
ncbi:MAG: bifunctional DNA-formamidopyrimidine glycosylase/DNA-(apurinic or apyrimidinic site) lyase [Candidatus Magasanikbacteria bacterium]|nr:bifunctional DNA-formamidopyrimidine glycosylase/DNA-(apurinic or apyrimidinic site) lyase [Candidatus Magasanikbacteria bacterium]